MHQRPGRLFGGRLVFVFFLLKNVDLQPPWVTLPLLSVPLQPSMHTLQSPLVALEAPSNCAPKC